MIAQAYSYSPCVAYPTLSPMNCYPSSPMLPMPACADPYQSFLNAMNQMQNLQMSGFIQGYMDGLAARSQMDPYLGFPSPYYDSHCHCDHDEAYEHHNHAHAHKTRPHLPKLRPLPNEISREREVVLTDKDDHGVVTSKVPEGGEHRTVRVDDRPERKATVDLATNENGSAQTETTVVETPEVETVHIEDVDDNSGNSAVVVEGDHVIVTNPGDTPDQNVVTEYKEEVGLVEGLGRGIDQFFGGKPERRTYENVSQVDIIHNQDGSQTTMVTDADGQMHSVQTGQDGLAQKTGEWVDDRVHDVVDFAQNVGQGFSDLWNSLW
ncbi:MAG: hypothetical protein KF760_23935 [Candidatus Eremiobacteraeota bacterium]|nr:hypothetical protein [Candidatus Eremiobacteraeota bacterium]MCW5866596.1 hypothetical protein [Candidatus Eremiobacteraeota bacterium]